MPTGRSRSDNLAEQVGHAFKRHPAAEIDGPFALDGVVDEGLTPERFRQRAVARHQTLEPRTLDFGVDNRRHRRDGMIHHRQQERVRVATLAGKQKVDDLAPTVLERLVAAEPARQHEADTVDRIALRDQILARSCALDSLEHCVFKRGAGLRRQGPQHVQPANDRVHHAAI
ncbi:hypothetical protein ACVWW5_003805 [Bradyrhizobium sp. LM3.4]